MEFHHNEVLPWIQKTINWILKSFLKEKKISLKLNDKKIFNIHYLNENYGMSLKAALVYNYVIVYNIYKESGFILEIF